MTVRIPAGTTTLATPPDTGTCADHALARASEEVPVSPVNVTVPATSPPSAATTRAVTVRSCALSDVVDATALTPVQSCMAVSTVCGTLTKAP